MHYKSLYLLVLSSFFIISCETGCIDDTACNYNELATADDGSCLFELDCTGECGGAAVADCAGECGGAAIADCVGVCGGTAVADCAGVCEGTAEVDVCGVCGGYNESDDNCVNCGDSNANNYVENATIVCEDANGDGNPDCCTYNNPDAADDKVDEANEQLFDDLEDIFDQDAPEDFNDFDQYFNLTESHELYSEALELDTENNGAFFGLAYSEILSFSQDQRLYNAFNEWTDCIDDLTEDDVSISGSDNGALSRSQFANPGFRFGMPISGKAFYAFNNIDIMNFLPIITSHNDVMLYSNELCPEIDNIQDLLENVFLSRISTAISHMDNVVGKDFVFTLTPDMLGDEDQEKIELDDTVFYLMKALLHQLRAMMYMVITYNVNVPYYDIVIQEGQVPTDYNWQWLAQDSDLLTIRSGQENSFSNAHADLNNVLNSIESAWTFLKTDNETLYDVILEEDVTDMEKEMEEDLDTNIDEFLADARKVLNEDNTVTFTIESCTSTTTTETDDSTNVIISEEEVCDTDEIELTYNIKNFLTNPPQNLKAIIPPYTLETRVCAYEDSEHISDNVEMNYSIDAVTDSTDADTTSTSMYFVEANCDWDNNEKIVSASVQGNTWDILPASSKQEFQIHIYEICAKIITDHADYDIEYFNLDYHWDGHADEGNIINLDKEYSWDLEYIETGNFGAPIPSWTATSCDEWQSGWDLTIGGLFPNMTTTKFFDEIIELEDDDCEEILEEIDCEDF